MSHKIFRSFFVLILIIGLGAVTVPQSAHAAGPWYVSTTGSDGNDCLSPATTCATINGALNKPGFVAGDTILVATGVYFGTGNEVVLLNKDVTLSGGWIDSFTSRAGFSTIDGEEARRGLYVLSVATVEAFIIRNGTVLNTNSAGGIWNEGTLTLTKSLVDNNSEDFGGGIVNIGTLIVNYSTVSGNSAATFGGGILNNGTLTLNYSTVSGNSSTMFGGGGIANSGGTVTLNNSTVSGNFTPSAGGGLLNSGGPTGTITLNYTTVSDNTANQDGGGIANFSNTGTITLNSSIVAGNIGPSGINDITADCLDNNFMLVSQGYNVLGPSCALFGTGDVLVAPASVFTDILSDLANNGGLTQTHALSSNLSNPALDAIPSGTNDCGSAPFDTDQRVVTRPQNTQCDIGAFELEATGGVEEVTIDIIPGNQTNLINRNRLGTIPVAILSSADFNALSEVDRTSLTFGRTGDEHSLVSCNKNGKDVNGDGLLDLACNFRTNLTDFQNGNTVGTLKGQTVNDVPIEGQDIVKVVTK